MSNTPVPVEQAQLLFPHRAGHLSTATIGLPPDSTMRAMEEALALWATGSTSTHAWDGSVQRSRELFAALIGVHVKTVSVGSNISAMVGLIGAALRPGQTVLLPEGDFTSLLWPFLVQERRGVRIKTVPLEALVTSIDKSIDWVAVSSVQSSTGAVIDLVELSAAAKAHGARTFVDTTQSQGWLPIDGSDLDVVACSAYKWLLSPRGTAFMAITEDLWDEVVPINAGWYAGQDVHTSFYGTPLRLADNARRFDLSPAWMCFAGTVPSLELIAAVGENAINAHNVGLANSFLTLAGRPAGDSAIVALAASPTVIDQLRSAKLHFSERAGKVRLSFHLYNDAFDVERAAACWDA